MKKRIFSALLALAFALTAGMTVCLAENESGAETSFDPVSAVSEPSDTSSDPTSSEPSDVSSDPSSEPSSDPSSDTSSDVSSGGTPVEVSYGYTPQLGRTSVNLGAEATLALTLTKNGSPDFSFIQLNAMVTVPFAITTASYTVAGTKRTVDVEKNGANSVFDIAYNGAAVSASGGVTVNFTVDEDADLGQFYITLSNVELCEANSTLAMATGTATRVRLTIGERYPQLSELSVDGLNLSEPFSPDIQRYEVTVPADTTEVVIRAKAKSAQATISYKDRVYADGVIPVTLTDDSTTVTLTVSSGGNYTYRITFTKEDTVVSDISSEDVSSDMTSTESTPDASEGTIPGTIASENTSSEVGSGAVGGTVSVDGNGGDQNGMGLVTILLIVLLALACGFVFCLILVRNGVFGGKDEDDEHGHTTDFAEKPVDEVAFAKASTAKKNMETAYTATRVMSIPQAETEKTAPAKKFEINIQYDDLSDATAAVGVAADESAAEETVAAEPKKEETVFNVFKVEERADDVFSDEGKNAMESVFDVKKPEDGKGKKKSFFFDDEEF